MDSILNSTKKLLSLDSTYTPFDTDITILINSSFSVLAQIGVLTDSGFSITNSQQVWSSLNVSPMLLNMIKTYVFLKVKYSFDPPATSFLLDAVKSEIKEYESRLMMLKEYQDAQI